MLDLLLRCAAREAARAAILIVKGSELQGWKFVGFGARTENPTEFRQALVGSGVIEEAIRTAGAAYTHGPVRVPAPAFAELPLGRKAVGVPLIIRGRPVAVLYADQGQSPHQQDVHVPSEGVSWPVAVELMTRHASRCLEAATVLRSAQPGQAPRRVPCLRNPSAQEIDETTGRSGHDDLLCSQSRVLRMRNRQPSRRTEPSVPRSVRAAGRAWADRASPTCRSI